MTANSRAALRGSRAFGVALSYAATAAARSSRRRSLMGIARVFLGCAKAAPVGRGHKHPRSLKKRLCDAVELGDAVFARESIPRHCRMFMAHLHRWALAFQGSGS